MRNRLATPPLRRPSGVGDQLTPTPPRRAYRPQRPSSPLVSDAEDQPGRTQGTTACRSARRLSPFGPLRRRSRWPACLPSDSRLTSHHGGTPVRVSVVEAVRAARSRRERLRADLTVADLLLLLQHPIGEAAEYTREVAPEVWRRVMMIALDGLRPTGGDPPRCPSPTRRGAGRLLNARLGPATPPLIARRLGYPLDSASPLPRPRSSSISTSNAS